MIELLDVSKVFVDSEGKEVAAVSGLTLDVAAGETVSLIGTSGSGKTTTMKLINRLIEPTSGRVLFDGKDITQWDVIRLRRSIGYVIQRGGLFPHLSVAENIGLLCALEGWPRERTKQRVDELLRLVNLPPEDYAGRFPRDLSGGQRQRVGVARALALDPHLVVADEAVSALDVSVRAQILNLLQDLQEEMELTYLFVSHDLSVIEYLCDRVAVMYVGKLVELATTDELFSQPRHPYTEALLSAVPKPNPRLRHNKQRIVLEGDVADPANPPSGCYFHPRCLYAKERCAMDTPELRDVGNGHFVACHFAEELTLRGAEPVVLHVE